jgi:hypothetical protein
MSRYYFKEPKKGLYPTEGLSLKLYRLLTEKGKDMKRSGTFSKDAWTQYVISLGCEFTDETFVLDSEREIIFRDEHHFTQLKDSKAWDRLIKVDFETAMRIATLGLP